MKTEKPTSSASTKEIIAIAVANLKGKELFIKKTELAKRSLSDLKSLPL